MNHCKVTFPQFRLVNSAGARLSDKGEITAADTHVHLRLVYKAAKHLSGGWRTLSNPILRSAYLSHVNREAYKTVNKSLPIAFNLPHVACLLVGASSRLSWGVSTFSLRTAFSQDSFPSHSALTVQHRHRRPYHVFLDESFPVAWHVLCNSVISLKPVSAELFWKNTRKRRRRGQI